MSELLGAPNYEELELEVDRISDATEIAIHALMNQVLLRVRGEAVQESEE